MIAMKRGCLNPEEIQHVLNGRMVGEDFDSALAHLDDCESCRHAAELCESHEPWLVQTLRGDHDPLQAETACQVGLWQIMDTPEFSRSGAPIPPPHSNSFPAQSLGPYDLIQSLGSGGMAAVYLADHRRLKRRCAIKILPRERVDQPGWLERFDREMTTIASLEHPNVVRATDAGHEDGWHYLVMEYLEGLDVGRIANRIELIEVADACEMVRQAALGLQHIHDNGLVHRDVKPSNMMLTRDGMVRLLDLGLVLSGDDPLSVDDRLTTVGHLMGTMPYMAPEQLLDSRDVDSRADIYALGATLYRLLAGSPPHAPRGGLAKQVMAITGQDAPRLKSVRDDVEADLDALVAAMIDRDPDGRPATASEVAISLERWACKSQLKRLLRSAARRPDADLPYTVTPPVVPQATYGSGSGNRPKLPSWLVAAAGFLAFVLAGWMIKIATDKGDLIISGATTDVMVEVRQGETVVDTLQVKSDGENEFSLRKGKYEISIVGATDLTLNKDMVTIGRGSRIGVVLESSTPERLYRGKNLNDWMQLLTREEDPNALGDVMAAVEVLTRDTDDRIEAARRTFETARIWGGYVAGSPTPNQLGIVDEEPSHHYMYHLDRIFPRYKAEGIPAIRDALKKGNVQSRLAAMWMLNKQPYYQMQGVPQIWLEELRIAIKALDESETDYGQTAALSGRQHALRWILGNDIPLATQTWLHSHIREIAGDRYRSWKKDPEPEIGIGTNYRWDPYLDEALLSGAIQLNRLGKLELDWEWVAAILFNPRYSPSWSDRTNEIIQLVADKDLPALLEAINLQLQYLRTPTVEGTSYSYSLGPADSFWANRTWIPVFQLGQVESPWPLALEIYSEHYPDVESALDTLRAVRQTMLVGGVLEDHSAKPLQSIDLAIERLEQRLKAK